MPATASSSNKYFKIEGLDQLNVLFTNLSPALKKGFQATTGKYATSMYREMTSRVPVRTGYLKSTIGSSSSPDRLELYVTADYAGYVNYGTSRMKARPFFTAVVNEQSPKLIEELNKVISNYIASKVK